MGSFIYGNGNGAYCVEEKKGCVGWAEKYFGDCLCSIKDDVSFAMGMASLLCWAVAEIPQILSNFRTKSSHGVSLSFLLAWVAGDIFNLVGCLLEPATLPTQLYTALVMHHRLPFPVPAPMHVHVLPYSFQLNVPFYNMHAITLWPSASF